MCHSTATIINKRAAPVCTPWKRLLAALVKSKTDTEYVHGYKVFGPPDPL